MVVPFVRSFARSLGWSVGWMDDGDYKTRRFTARPRESDAAEGFYSPRATAYVASTARSSVCCCAMESGKLFTDRGDTKNIVDECRQDTRRDNRHPCHDHDKVRTHLGRRALNWQPKGLRRDISYLSVDGVEGRKGWRRSREIGNNKGYFCKFCFAILIAHSSEMIQKLFHAKVDRETFRANPQLECNSSAKEGRAQEDNLLRLLCFVVEMSAGGGGGGLERLRRVVRADERH